MKGESRVLVSHCEGQVCAGVVVRLGSVDGVIVSTSGCEGLAKRASETGYAGELRACVGPCTLGLPEAPPRTAESVMWALELAKALVSETRRLIDNT